MPVNTCIELFTEVDDDLSVRATANVVGKTFGAISADIQSGPAVTTTALPATWDGGNFQAATCPAGAKADGVFAYDALAGQLLPLKAPGKIVPVTAGAAITAGQEVQSDAAGKAIPLAAGRACGKAYTTAASGTDCFVRLYA